MLYIVIIQYLNINYYVKLKKTATVHMRVERPWHAGSDVRNAAVITTRWPFRRDGQITIKTEGLIIIY